MPHSFRPLTVRGIYGRLIVALAILIAGAITRSGGTVVVLLVAAMGAAILAELAIGIGADTSLRRSGIGNGRVLYMAMLIVALVPPETGPLTVAAAAAAAVLIGVWLPGGPRAYWMHPALLGLALVPGLTIVFPADPLAGSAARLIGVIEQSRLFGLFDGWMSTRFGLHVSAEALTAIAGFPGGTPATLTAGLLLPLMGAAMVVLGEDLVPPALPVSFLAAFVVMVELLGGESLPMLVAGNTAVLAFVGLAEPGVRPMHKSAILGFGILGGIGAAVFTVVGGVGMPAVAGILIAGLFRSLLDAAGLELRRVVR